MVCPALDRLLYLLFFEVAFVDLFLNTSPDREPLGSRERTLATSSCHRQTMKREKFFLSSTVGYSTVQYAHSWYSKCTVQVLSAVQYCNAVSKVQYWPNSILVGCETWLAESWLKDYVQYTVVHQCWTDDISDMMRSIRLMAPCAAT